jgi:hypothetical protein
MAEWLVNDELERMCKEAVPSGTQAGSISASAGSLCDYYRLLQTLFFIPHRDIFIISGGHEFTHCNISIRLKAISTRIPPHTVTALRAYRHLPHERAHVCLSVAFNSIAALFLVAEASGSLVPNSFEFTWKGEEGVITSTILFTTNQKKRQSSVVNIFTLFWDKMRLHALQTDCWTYRAWKWCFETGEVTQFEIRKKNIRRWIHFLILFTKTNPFLNERNPLRKQTTMGCLLGWQHNSACQNIGVHRLMQFLFHVLPLPVTTNYQLKPAREYSHWTSRILKLDDKRSVIISWYEINKVWNNTYKLSSWRAIFTLCHVIRQLAIKWISYSLFPNICDGSCQKTEIIQLSLWTTASLGKRSSQFIP